MIPPDPKKKNGNAANARSNSATDRESVTAAYFLPTAPTTCKSVRQLAAFWRCSPARVRQLVRRGILQAFLVGRALRISPQAITAAERLLAAPTSGSRRRRADDGIDPTVKALLNED